MQSSGIAAAIRELERQEKNIQEAIRMLKRMAGGSVSVTTPNGRKRVLSASARKRISDAAKRRWAAVRSAKTPQSRAKS